MSDCVYQCIADYFKNFPNASNSAQWLLSHLSQEHFLGDFSERSCGRYGAYQNNQFCPANQISCSYSWQSTESRLEHDLRLGKADVPLRNYSYAVALTHSLPWKRIVLQCSWLARWIISHTTHSYHLKAITCHYWFKIMHRNCSSIVQIVSS